MKKNKYLLLLPLRSIIFIMIFLITALLTKKSVEEISIYWTIIVVICNLLTIGVLLLLCKKEKITYLELIGFKKSKVKTILLIGIVIAIIDAIGAYLFELLFNDVATSSSEILMHSLPIWLVVVDLILLPITSTIAEEGLYLGVGINKLDNIYLAILFYAMQHCFFPMILNYRYFIYRFIAFMPSIIFMCIYYKKKKEILPIMFEHFVVNLVTIVQILLISL